MRKMKKINGFLVVKFNSRELREWGDMGLGNFGIIDAEIYTGKLEIDRGAMEYDDIETIEEAVEMARGLNAEEDYTAQPSTYAVVEEVVNDVVERVEVDPQFLIDRWTKTLKKQIKNPHHPGVNTNTARHELYGFKVALSELGLLDADECLVFRTPSARRGRSPNRSCLPMCVIRCVRNEYPGVHKRSSTRFARSVTSIDLPPPLGRGDRHTKRSPRMYLRNLSSTRNHPGIGRFWLE